MRKKLESNEALITHWFPSLLLMKLDDILWQNSDDIQIKKLWEYFCTYCYLPRLSSFAVLEECIMAGVQGSEYFAYAEGISNGRYLDLKYNTFLSSVNEYGYLVKINTALKQLVSDWSRVEEQKPTSGGTSATTAPANGGETASMPQQPERPQNTRFYLSTPLDTMRINKDVNNLVQEVINYLSGLDGADVEITLEVSAKIPDGAPIPIVRTVTENCRTLKVQDFGFSD